MCGAIAAGLQEDLVEVEDGGATDEGGDGVDNFGFEGEGLDEAGKGGGGAELEVFNFGGVGFAVAIGGDVAEAAFGFEACDIGLEAGDFFRR